MAFANNYTLGRGKIYFDRFASGTKTKTGERYLGNTPSFSVGSAIQNLDHFSSDSGVRLKDASVQLQNDRTAKFSTDNVSANNVALMFGTEMISRTTLSSSGASDTLTVQQGLYYQLGASSAVPEGLRNLTNVSVSDSSGTVATQTITLTGQPTAADTVTIHGIALTFVAGAAGNHEVSIGGTATITAQALRSVINQNSAALLVNCTGAALVLTLHANASGVAGNSITLTESAANLTVGGATLAGGTSGGNIPAAGNWTMDETKGRLLVLDDAVSIADDDSIVVTYDIGNNEQTVNLDEGNEVRGALRFIADNPEGENRDKYFPYVKLTPNGDYNLKAETWLVMEFNVEILRLDDETPRGVDSN